jgi:hypothetical protein
MGSLGGGVLILMHALAAGRERGPSDFSRREGDRRDERPRSGLGVISATGFHEAPMSSTLERGIYQRPLSSLTHLYRGHPTRKLLRTAR